MVSSNELEKLVPLAFQQSSLPFPERYSGKVRDWYILDNQRRLLVTTDRLSAFDRVLAAVPYKGQVLNQLSAWWFDCTKDIIPNHVISLPDPNALLAREVEPIPVEVIVRGYISGVTTTSLWYRYAMGERSVYGYIFPEGLHKNERFRSRLSHQLPRVVRPAMMNALPVPRWLKKVTWTGQPGITFKTQPCPFFGAVKGLPRVQA